MSDSTEGTYRLMFRGELLGTVPAPEVEAKLKQLLRLSDAQCSQMFSGDAVVLKREADRATAAQFQQAFKRAGARLRVTPNDVAPPAPRKTTLAERLAQQDLERQQATSAAADDAEAPATRSAAAAVREAGAGSGLDLAPVGALVLSPDERAPVAAADINTTHLSAAPAGDDLTDKVDGPEPLTPDVSHLQLDEIGVDLSTTVAHEPVLLDLSHLELDEPGVVLVEPAAPVTRDVDTSALSVAPVGAALGVPGSAPINAPDVAHLQLADR